MRRTTYDALRAVSAITGLSLEQITGDCRMARLVTARAATAIIARDHLNRTWLQIGRALNRDHTSIINVVQGYRDDVATMAIVESALIYMQQPTWHDRLLAASVGVKHRAPFSPRIQSLV